MCIDETLKQSRVNVTIIGNAVEAYQEEETHKNEAESKYNKSYRPIQTKSINWSDCVVINTFNRYYLSASLLLCSQLIDCINYEETQPVLVQRK